MGLICLGGAATMATLTSFSFYQEDLSGGGGTPPTEAAPVPPPFESIDSQWADSVFQSLTPEQRIGQLFMVAAYSNRDQAHEEGITKLVEEQGIGGLIFFQGGPLRQARQTNDYQQKAKVPLLIAIDGEWGLAMRLDSTIKYPRQMMLGAIENDDLVYRMGADIARQCKRIGIHVNLAPVVDVNVNPNNPVINSRSFGEDKKNVARKAAAYMRGMQEQGVMANAKHFPGHGDTDSDSHKTLPIIKHDRMRMDSIELYPFRELINQGLGSMMVAHLFIPELDSTENRASTLSKPIVTGLLKEELGFKGLVFTDALNMKGVSAFYEPGDVDLKALLAGNDVLLFPEDVPKAISRISEALKKGEISQDEIDKRCMKILKAKQWAGLNEYKPVKLANLYEELNASEYDPVQRELVKNSMTLVRNEDNTLPIVKANNMRIASVSVGDKDYNRFQETMDRYAKVDRFYIRKSPTKAEKTALLEKLEGYELVIVGVHKTSRSPRRKFGIPEQTVSLIDAISEQFPTVATLFANPYSLAQFEASKKVNSIIIGYEDTPLAQEYAAQLIFGGIAATGTLPISASPSYRQGMGIQLEKPIRFEYTVPEAAGIASSDLARIEELAMEGIEDHAYPGCQIFVAKEGKVIYNRSFGHYTYEEKQEVMNNSVYDLASITKISATLAAIMKLNSEGKVNLDYNLCDYLSEEIGDSSDYFNMNLRDMLAHQAGLVSWIPFYQETLVKGVPRYDVYSLTESEVYSLRVAENFYINKNYRDSIIQRIVTTPLRKKKEYKYSDLGYYFMQKIVEKVSGQTLDEYTAENFYQPMGLGTMGFLPRERFPMDRLVPTEYDMKFRKQLVHGDVHDPGAAMMGGVGGHAGLFSNAEDLAKMMQMYLNWGTYGGTRYIEEDVVKDFARCQFCETSDNRRGAGFDKPVRNGGSGPTCNCVSYDSFGHTGFTGTIAWADPDEQIVYVFLSNRVYPDAGNRKLIKSGIRTRIMQVIYDAVEKSKAGKIN